MCIIIHDNGSHIGHILEAGVVPHSFSSIAVPAVLFGIQVCNTLAMASSIYLIHYSTTYGITMYILVTLL